MIATVIVVALLALLGLLLFQIVQAYRVSKSAGARSLAGTILPVLVLVLVKWLGDGSLSPVFTAVEDLNVAVRLVIAMLAGAVVVLVVDRSNPESPVGELLTSALLIWVIWTGTEASKGSQTTFIYAIGGLIGAALYLVVLGRRNRIVTAATSWGARGDTKS